MKLCTECHWDGWDRIVDIYPERSDKLPEYINDPENYKIIILEKGALEIKSEGKTRTVNAPALIGLSQKDVLDYKILKPIKTYILFFKPTVIREEFTCTLNETEKKIYTMLESGYTQREIADELGYKSHNSASRRIDKIREKLTAFLESNEE